ncbi:NAD(P)-dependent oxidoreductase [Mycobacterium sp. 1081908.1]|uniref:NAD(P)-dependent oxidoreductase n=1 Tax=Mycobacterium sp. 1081908.1 TaxID=1834066 RepID=UPI0007FEF045|nr:NAD(P)H-binding protein [Mycobacterium sp. 1081908.1]OBK45378.1 NAD-dependent epimerase [Mycobacterium sp. 1081908.1]
MTTIAIFGATGYSGGNIADEALSRGHRVIAVARNTGPLAGRTDMDVRQGSLFDEQFVRDIAVDADVVVVALPAHGTGLADYLATLGRIAAHNAVRIGVVGGAGNLRVSPDGPRALDTPIFPEEFREDGIAHAEVLAGLRALPEGVDWFSLSPPALYNSENRGERTGIFRVGEDVLLIDAEGNSHIGGADYAIAFVDEIDNPRHHRALFTVAY